MAETDEVARLGEMAVKTRTFEEGIAEIEKKHLAFFTSRVSIHNLMDHDHLANHFTLNYNSIRHSIHFENSGLPIPIRIEVEELFQRVWGDPAEEA
jgi:hypothetical protein